jgi:hypothetical protein
MQLTINTRGIIRNVLNQKLINNLIKVDKLTDGYQLTLVIFNYIDRIIDKKLFKQVIALNDQIL